MHGSNLDVWFLLIINAVSVSAQLSFNNQVNYGQFSSSMMESHMLANSKFLEICRTVESWLFVLVSRTGTVRKENLEAEGNSACLECSCELFVRGWSAQLHERGHSTQYLRAGRWPVQAVSLRDGESRYHRDS